MVGEHLNEATINRLRAFPNEANKYALDALYCTFDRSVIHNTHEDDYSATA
jgi:hypothetical protein